MGNENGEWILYGVPRSDPDRIKTVEELEAYVNRVGFLPLFRNSVPGFSLEEHTLAADWWTDDPARDPWQWRKLAAAGGKVAYGKFFDKKAGFVSLDWLPRFVNYRRAGYDFDVLWEDELASYRQKKIMDLFTEGGELFGYEMKRRAGFGRDGEKGFEGTVAELEMKTYLVIRDFRCRLNKFGLPYGWPVTVYTTPEALWGAELVTSAYDEKPAESGRSIREHLEKTFPGASPEEWDVILHF